MDFNVGDEIRIISMNGEPEYNGRTGTITKIGNGPYHDVYLRGTWGGLNIYPLEDTVEVISKKE